MVALLIVCVCCSGVAAIVLWTLHRSDRRDVPARIGRVVGGSLLALGLAAGGTAVWATNSTDTSQVARSIVWGGSAVGDQHRFPSRPMLASANPLSFPVEPDPALATFDDELESNDTNAFIVLQHGNLLYEGYFNGSDHDDIQTSFSVAKSFVATLVGIAIDQGFIDGLDDPLTQHLPELLERDEQFAEITLHHLITMSSGLSFEEGSSPWSDPANTYHGTDLRHTALNTPSIEEPPGVNFDYNDWNAILLGMVIERSTGMSVSDFAQTRLWKPMGAEADGSWSLDSERHGFEKSFVGVNGRAIDFAKLGVLYLNDGVVGDEAVISSSFVADATRNDDTTDPAGEYQYLWWIDEKQDAFYANGDHGQFIYVDPQAEVVIVRHGTGPGDVDWIPFFRDVVAIIESD